MTGRALIVQGDDLCCCCWTDDTSAITACGCHWCYICVGREHHLEPHDCDEHGCTDPTGIVEVTP